MAEPNNEITHDSLERLVDRPQVITCFTLPMRYFCHCAYMLSLTHPHQFYSRKNLRFFYIQYAIEQGI